MWLVSVCRGVPRTTLMDHNLCSLASLVRRLFQSLAVMHRRSLHLPSRTSRRSKNQKPKLSTWIFFSCIFEVSNGILCYGIKAKTICSSLLDHHQRLSSRYCDIDWKSPETAQFHNSLDGWLGFDTGRRRRIDLAKDAPFDCRSGNHCDELVCSDSSLLSIACRTLDGSHVAQYSKTFLWCQRMHVGRRSRRLEHSILPRILFCSSLFRGS